MRIRYVPPSDTPDDPQALHCAGCGAVAPSSTVTWSRSQKLAGADLIAVPDWRGDGRVALLCARCRYLLRKNRGRARYSKARPSDGRMT
jgi:hypothetical protein